jgi:hypothetical protein
MCLLYHAGAPDHVIAAGLLHDTIERTDAHPKELEVRFGPRVATLVLTLTEDRRITRQLDREVALRDQVAGAGRDALTVFAADRISKLRELRREDTAATRPRSAGIPATWERRLTRYRQDVRVIDQNLPDSPLVGKLATELELLMGVVDERSAQPGSSRL